MNHSFQKKVLLAYATVVCFLLMYCSNNRHGVIARNNITVTQKK